jgi:hypothetical protein
MGGGGTAVARSQPSMGARGARAGDDDDNVPPKSKKLVKTSCSNSFYSEPLALRRRNARALRRNTRLCRVLRRKVSTP